MNVTAEIQRAQAPADLQDLLTRIGTESPDHLLPLHVAEIYRSFARLADGGLSTRAPSVDERAAGNVFMAYVASRGAYVLESGMPQELTIDAAAHLWSTTRVLPPSIRALASGALWGLRKQWQWAKSPRLPKPFAAAQDAIISHADAAMLVRSACAGDPAGAGMIESKHWEAAVQIAAELSRFDEIATRSPDLLAGVSAYADSAPHWAVGLIQCIVRLARESRRRSAPGAVPEAELRTLLGMLASLQTKLVQMRHMEHVEAELLEVRSALEALLGAPPDQKETRRWSAELFMDHAARAESKLAASQYLKFAAEAFAQAGLQDKASTAKQQARTAINEALSGGEFQEIVVPFRVPAPVVDSILAPYFDGVTDAGGVLQKLGHHFFAPSLDGSQRPPRQPSLMSQIALTVPVVDDRTLAGVSPGTTEAALFQEQRELCFEIASLSGLLLEPAFERLKGGFSLTANDLVSATCPDPANDDERSFIAVAAERYLASSN